MIKQSNAFNTTQVIVNEIINCYTDINFDLNKDYELVPLSKEHLRKLFIKEHGVSPTQFLKQQRLSLAKQLLSRKENDALRINEIAFSCGFEDPAYFCRIFKKEMGVAPQYYKLQLLNSNKIFEEEKHD
jgi:YesN/AraC family two-component response regulator